MSIMDCVAIMWTVVALAYLSGITSALQRIAACMAEIESDLARIRRDAQKAEKNKRL